MRHLYGNFESAAQKSEELPELRSNAQTDKKKMESFIKAQVIVISKGECSPVLIW